MFQTEHISLTLLDVDDRTVTLEAVRTSLRLSVGHGAVFADYTRPVRVIDRRGSDLLQHRIVDVGAVTRLTAFLAAAGTLRLRRRPQ